MEVEQSSQYIDIAGILSALFADFSAVTDYRTLRDSLPRYLAGILHCRCVLLYLRVDETLQLASGSYDDAPGWSSALLAVAHMNPVSVQSDVPEARAWREQQVIAVPVHSPTLMAIPLHYRRRGIGVLVAIRGQDEGASPWPADAAAPLGTIAGVIALLLENTRLLERDRERIHELSLLNSMSSQMHTLTYDLEHVRNLVLQRTREIARVDLCDLLLPSTTTDDIPWLSPDLIRLLFERFQEQSSLAPLLVERISDGYNEYAGDYFAHLPANVKTFFALPLLSSRSGGRYGLLGGLEIDHELARLPRVLGCIVGAYYRPWKVRPAEVSLLQVLSNQASAVLENIRLMSEVLANRNQARQLLRQVLEDQQTQDLILSSMPGGLISTDEHGRVSTFNRAAEVLLGYRAHEVIGEPLQKFLVLKTVSSTEDVLHLPPLQSPALAAMHTGEPQNQTVTTTDRFGRELVLDVDVRPLFDVEDKRRGTLVTFTDMTAMHRLEEEKRRLDHLASLGELSASVAHEVRNPLASIKTSVQLLRDELLDCQAGTDRPPEDTAEQLHWMLDSTSVVLKEVNRLDTIVRDLLLFARPRQLQRTRCTLSSLLEHMLDVVQHQCVEAHIAVNHVFEDMPDIWLDVGQIEQVLLNLLLNAIQAMPDGGTLTLASHCIPSEEAIFATAGRQSNPTQRPSGASGTSVNAYAWLIDKHASQQEFRVQRWLEITVSDTGMGISSEQLAHIFQPFYTTKAHGIGLGLAISRRLVEDHGGYLYIDSQFHCGTTVSIRLPFVVQVEMDPPDSTIS